MTALLLRGAVAASLILATWLIQIASWVGIGLLARRLLTRRPLEADGLPLTAWYGLSLSILVLQIWHLWLPVTGAATLLLGGAAVAGLVIDRASVARAISGIAATEWRGPAAAALVVTGWLATEAAAPCCTYDTAMYQLPFVDWTHAYAIVPGLANLYANFGFNSSGLLYAAALDTGPWAGHGSHIAFGASLALLSTLAIAAGVRWWRSGVARPVDVFRCTLLAPVLTLAAGGGVSSYETDVIAGALLLGGAAEAYAALSGAGSDPAPSGHRETIPRLHMVVVVLAAASTLKLSTLAFGLALGGALLWHLARVAPAGHRFPRRALAATLAGVLLLIGTWGLRGGILSGYPLYPARALALPVDWKVPAAQAEGTRLWIRHAARTAAVSHDPSTEGDIFESGLRVPHVLEETLLAGGVDHTSDGATVWMATLPLFLALIALLAIRRPRWREDPLRWFLPAIAVTLAMWFVTAPAARFALPIWWILAACLVAAAARFGTRIRDPRRVAAATLLAIGAAPALVPVADAWIEEGSLESALRAAFFTRPPARGLYESPLEPTFEAYRTDSGLVLHVPADDGMRCYTIPVPCTPHPQPGLVARDPGDPGAGYAVDGAWRPERWPNTWRAADGRDWSRTLRERHPPDR